MKLYEIVKKKITCMLLKYLSFKLIYIRLNIKGLPLNYKFKYTIARVICVKNKLMNFVTQY